MAFVNPNILAQIFGQNGKIASMDPAKQQGMTAMLAGAGGAMSQAAARPGAGFGESLGAGAQGMMQGKQQAQQMQMQQQQMQQMQKEMQRKEKMQKLMGDILGGGGGDFASRATEGMATRGPQTTPLQGGGQLSAQPIQPGFNNENWDRIFPGMTERMIQTESGGRQFGSDGQPLRSPKGATGITQVMPGTGPEAAELAGVAWDPERFQNDEGYNRQLGTAYLNHLGGRYDGDPILASAAYNWGMGNVDRLISEVGDPRQNPEAYGEFIRRLPKETQNYVQKVGMPAAQEAIGPRQVGASQQGQAQPAPAQAQQGGYQQGAQQGASQMFAGLPPETRQILSMMEPEQAMKAMFELQTGGGQDTPARIQEAQVIAEQTGQPVGEVLAQMRGLGEGSGEPEDQRARKIRDYQELYGLSRADAVKMADSIGQPEFNPATGRLQGWDPINQRAFEVEVAPAQQIAPDEQPEKTLFDLTYETGTTGISGTAHELAGRVFGQGGFFSPGEESAQNRQTLTMASRDLVRALQNNPRYAEGERKSIAEEINIQPSAFDSPPALRARMRSIHSSLNRRLATEQRIANDPSMGEDQRQAAKQAASDIQRFLIQLGDPPPAEEGQRGSGGQMNRSNNAGTDPETEALIDRWAD